MIRTTNFRFKAGFAAANFMVLASFMALSSQPGRAQGSLVPGGSAPSGAGTGTVQSAPLAPVPGTAAPVEVKPADAPPAIIAPPAVAAPPIVASPPATSAPLVTPPAAQAGPVDANATLAGKPGDAVNVDDLVLEAKNAAVTTGKSSWDDGPKNLGDAFARMRAEAEKAGVKVAGRPFAIFAETDDTSFRFEAFLPIDRIPDNRDQMGPDIKFTPTPAGRALRFVHKGPYDDVDSTYEVITAYLDAKGITVRDAFIEEYVGDLKDSSEASFELNIYVVPR